MCPEHKKCLEKCSKSDKLLNTSKDELMNIFRGFRVFEYALWPKTKDLNWLTCLKANPACGIYFRTSTQRGRWTGWEMAKELKTKSGQTTDKKYVSKWMFYEQLKFLRAVTDTTKSWDSVSTQKKRFGCFCFTSGKWTSENKYSKNYHCQEKIKAVSKMCRIHGTRFVF